VSVTAEQNRANLRSAERIVAVEMGVPVDGALPYAQRTEFAKRLAAKILEFPSRFTAATVSTARRVSGADYSPLADSSFSWSDFASAAVDNAVDLGEGAADIGRGAAAAGSALRWVIPAAVVVAVSLALVGFGRRTGAVK
jgi:hypothetical protein